jgi:recombination protein RecR
LQLIPRPIERLINEFSKLPGVGPRTAERLTFFLLRSGHEQAHELGEALQGMREGVQTCQVCFNLSDQTTCVICSNPQRNQQQIAVVEEPLDVVAIEKTGIYQGLYHVLGGVISPIEGIGPDKLTIKPLLQRLEGAVEMELIIATNPSTEGETTAMYIRNQLKDNPIKITRLARGLPVGGDLEYADQVTLGRALQGRQRFE